MYFVEGRRVGRFGQSQKDCLRGSCFLLEKSYKARYRLHRSGRSDSNERLAHFKLAINAVKLIRLLAKPANIRPHQGPAGTPWQLVFGISAIVGKRRLAAIRVTPALKQFAVNVHHVFRACGFMQTIHILRAQKKSFSTGLSCEMAQRHVRCIGFGMAGACAPVRIVSPHQLRVALPCFDVRQLMVAVAAPTGSLKDRYPALRADSRPRQDKDAAVPLHTNCSLPQVQTGL